MSTHMMQLSKTPLSVSHVKMFLLQGKDIVFTFIIEYFIVASGILAPTYLIGLLFI
jgi:hypothetical protein